MKGRRSGGGSTLNTFQLLRRWTIQASLALTFPVASVETDLTFARTLHANRVLELATVRFSFTSWCWRFLKEEMAK